LVVVVDPVKRPRDIAPRGALTVRTDGDHIKGRDRTLTELIVEILLKANDTALRQDRQMHRAFDRAPTGFAGAQRNFRFERLRRRSVR
jgi:hypothetical protein